MHSQAPHPILACSLGDVPAHLPAFLTFTHTPTSCLDAALSGGFAGILIDLHGARPAEEERLIELCGLLRKHLPSICIVALAPGVRKDLLESLQIRGVSGVRNETLPGVLEKCRADAGFRPLTCPSPGERLEAVCPHINQLPSPTGPGTPVCSAYRNRLVLGGTRLAFYCLGGNHRECEFFNKVKPDTRGPAHGSKNRAPVLQVEDPARVRRSHTGHSPDQLPGRGQPAHPGQGD